MKFFLLVSQLAPAYSSAYGSGGWGGGLQPPPVGKNSIIRVKLMYRSGKDTVR